MKILIIDDSRMDRRLLMKVLEKSGVENEILQAENGEEGLKVLSEHHDDVCLVLLDWQMPQLDGIGFMKAVIKAPQVADIPIVMITASGSEDNKKIAYDANPNLSGYVVKPYKKEQLVELIKPYLTASDTV